MSKKAIAFLRELCEDVDMKEKQIIALRRAILALAGKPEASLLQEAFRKQLMKAPKRWQ